MRLSLSLCEPLPGRPFPACARPEGFGADRLRLLPRKTVTFPDPPTLEQIRIWKSRESGFRLQIRIFGSKPDTGVSGQGCLSGGVGGLWSGCGYRREVGWLEDPRPEVEVLSHPHRNDQRLQWRTAMFFDSDDYLQADPAKAGSEREAKRLRREAEQRARLCEATTRLAAEGGLEAAAIHLAARRAGIGQGTYYKLYDSRDACLQEAFERCAETVFARVAEAAAEGKGLGVRIEAGLGELLHARRRSRCRQAPPGRHTGGRPFLPEGARNARWPASPPCWRTGAAVTKPWAARRSAWFGRGGDRQHPGAMARSRRRAAEGADARGTARGGLMGSKRSGGRGAGRGRARGRRAGGEAPDTAPGSRGEARRRRGRPGLRARRRGRRCSRHRPRGRPPPTPARAPRSPARRAAARGPRGYL